MIWPKPDYNKHMTYCLQPFVPTSTGVLVGINLSICYSSITWKELSKENQRFSQLRTSQGRKRTSLWTCFQEIMHLTIVGMEELFSQYLKTEPHFRWRKYGFSINQYPALLGKTLTSYAKTRLPKDCDRCSMFFVFGICSAYFKCQERGLGPLVKGVSMKMLPKDLSRTRWTNTGFFKQKHHSIHKLVVRFLFTFIFFSLQKRMHP